MKAFSLLWNVCFSLIAVVPFMLAPPSARAASFMLQENSTAQQGSSFAGTVSNPSDASTIFYNPAGMTELRGPQAQIGATVIVPRMDYTDTGSTVTTPASGGAVASGGGNGRQPFGPVVVPNMYAAVPVMERLLWAGIGVSAPFGLKDDYGTEWAGRYDSTKNELTVIDVAPSIAVKVTDQFSVGGGVNIQRASAKLQNALPDPTDATPGADTDGSAVLDGDGTAVGYNVGVLFKPAERLRFGAQYRGAVNNELDGRLTTYAPAAVGGAIARRDGKADLKLPDQATVGVAYDVDAQWTVMARGSWYGWSNFDEIRVRFDAGGADQVTPTNYNDSYGFAVGAEYRHDGSLTLRAGFQYDGTPTTDQWRTTSVPDSDRYWISAGGAYNINDRFSVDFAATHIFLKDNTISLSGASDKDFAALGSSATVRGGFEASVDILSLSVKYKF